MNNGAFGENFPYSNFHDLNMDWVLQVVKDFLDKYSTLIETIDTGKEEITTLYNELETRLNEWYETHSEDIAQELVHALENLNTAVTNKFADFNDDVNTRVEQAIASIPQDYSQLSEKVNTIDSNIKEKVNIDGIQEVSTANIEDNITNVLYYAKVKTIESYNNTVDEDIAEYTGNIVVGMSFTFMFDSVDGNTADIPFAIYVMNGSTQIRRAYTYQLTITESDISAGVNRVIMGLYPARGTAMPTGKATYNNVIALTNGAEIHKFTDRFSEAMLNAMTESNVLAHSKEIIVRGTGRYVEYYLYDYRGTIKKGDVFSIISDDPVGASSPVPFTITLYHNNTEIRHGNGKYIAIKDSDISNDVNRITFELYPAKGTALASGSAIYRNVYAIKGTFITYVLDSFYKTAVENTIVSSNILFEADSYDIVNNTRYADTPIYNEYLNDLKVGDCFSLIYDSVTGATDDYPQCLYLFNNNTQIRKSVFLRIEITDDDIDAGVNHVICELYPAKGTVMPTEKATYTNVKLVRGISKGNALNGQTAIATGDNSVKGIVPEYYFNNSYLKNKIKTIRNIANSCIANGDMFVFITDEHLDYNAGNSPALIKYITDQCNITSLMDCGDLADHGSNALEMAFRNNFKHQIHHACGNHEWMNPTDGNILYYMLDSHNNDQIGNNFEHYYYWDNRQTKIRYIVLNAYINNPDDSEIGAICGYNQSQLEWLTTQALTTPDNDWNIVVFTHFIGPYNASSISGYTDFLTAIDNHNSTNHDIICIMQGHTHYDAIWHTTGGIPIITTTCDKNLPWIRNGTNMEEYLSQYRPTGTIREQAFDVVIIDKELRKIHCVRIGCPAYNNTDISPSDPNFTYIPTLEQRTVNF